MCCTGMMNWLGCLLHTQQSLGSGDGSGKWFCPMSLRGWSGWCARIGNTPIVIMSVMNLRIVLFVFVILCCDYGHVGLHSCCVYCT